MGTPTTAPPLPPPSGTRDLADAEFVAAFEGLTLDADRFHHFDHLRLAWILLADLSLPDATARIIAGIRRFATHHAGNAAKYHDTITRAYMRLVAFHRAEMPGITSFDAFVERHPRLLEQRLLSVHYSDARLMSAEARTTWVEPDLHPLP